MPDFELQVDSLLTRIAAQLTERGWKMASAESCTGGWVAKCCTDRAGSSDWFDRGYVTYSNDAKEQMLAVSHEDLLEFGAVSEEIAGQMAMGARLDSGVDVTVSTTGIAGPGGGIPGKPVGLVYFGWCIGEQPVSSDSVVFDGDRDSVRKQTVLHALQGLAMRLELPD
jgi:nicotinamide-nucleotide amidase